MINEISFIDELLAYFEDFTHGEKGEEVTIARKYLTEIEDYINQLKEGQKANRIRQ